MARIKAYDLINVSDIGKNDAFLIETDSGTKTVNASDLKDLINEKMRYVELPNNQSLNNAFEPGVLYRDNSGSFIRYGVCLVGSNGTPQMQFMIRTDGSIKYRAWTSNGWSQAWTDTSQNIPVELIQHAIENYLVEHPIASGKSAYEIALEEGYQGTKAEWLDSLKGEQGPKGKGVVGADIDPQGRLRMSFEGEEGEPDDIRVLGRVVGADGSPGAKGTSFVDANVDSNGNLILTRESQDGEETITDYVNAGHVVGPDGAPGRPGEPGADYVLTEEDEARIAELVADGISKQADALDECVEPGVIYTVGSDDHSGLPRGATPPYRVSCVREFNGDIVRQYIYDFAGHIYTRQGILDDTVLNPVYGATKIATTNDIPTKMSDLKNDSGFVTSSRIAKLESQYRISNSFSMDLLGTPIIILNQHSTIDVDDFGEEDSDDNSSVYFVYISGDVTRIKQSALMPTPHYLKNLVCVYIDRDADQVELIDPNADTQEGMLGIEIGAIGSNVDVYYKGNFHIFDNVISAIRARGDGSGDSYTKAEIDTKLAEKADLEDIPDISDKADKSTTLAGYGITDGETTSHKVTAITSGANNTMYPSALAVYNALSGKESTFNKSTTIGSGSSDAQYPTAKAVYTAVSQREVKSNKVTEIGDNATDTQYPSALAVKKAIDAANPYVFVTEIPVDADHNKKYVLPDGYIWEWQEGTSSIPYNANTKIINKRPQTNANYEVALLNNSGTLVSDLIPFDPSWKYRTDATSGNLANINISGIDKLVPGYNNNAIILYYYKRENGDGLGAALGQSLASLNRPSAGSDIALPVQFSLMDETVFFTGMDTSNPGATIGYVRVMVGISTGSDITEDDVKDVVINVPFYDTPGTEAGWVSTGQKHPDYISDNVFDVDADQVLYAIGDSITYGYGVGGNNYSWVKHVIDHNGYAAYGTNGSKNLGENNLGFCTNSTSSFGNHSIQYIVNNTSFAEADIVTVALGINDWKNPNATLEQFWAGMQDCFDKIRTDNPYCKIYYILPFNVSFAGTFSSFYGLGFKGDSDTTKCYAYKLQEFINLIKAKFNEASFKAYRVELIDMTECAAINRNNITTALIDDRSSGGTDFGLHPTAATHAILGKEIARFIAQDRSVKDNSNYLTLDTLPIYNGGVQ